MEEKGEREEEERRRGEGNRDDSEREEKRSVGFPQTSNDIESEKNVN
jgi:hypothetical protein